jgi:2-methylfumaryl-CoA isomerase
MYDLLRGLRVIEGSSFIAGPSCGLHLAQMGADVIRFDQIGGGPDFRRWPLAPNGTSLYWEGLNKGKRSVAIDLGRPEGRELALTLATAPGEDGGVFLTNFPVGGFLSHEVLVAKRSNLITLRVMGWSDGSPAVDYTINAAAGIPLMTGPPDDPRPVNHVLPAWDLLAGAYGAFALVSALLRRRATGEGAELRISLSDIAATSLGHLGQVAEVVSGGDRARMGNALFGAFGRDFVCSDGTRIIIVAITGRQWSGLVKTLSLTEQIAALEADLGVSFARDEGVRFQHRERLFPLFERAIGGRSASDLGPAFASNGATWGPYQTLHEAVTRDAQLFTQNPQFQSVAQPSGVDYPSAGPACRIERGERGSPGLTPRLGQHTEEVLVEVLKLGSGEIGRLFDEGIVA